MPLDAGFEQGHLNDARHLPAQAWTFLHWTGDAQVFAPTACYLRDCAAFFSKYLWDIRSEQQALGGMVPMVVPDFGLKATSAAWGDAACSVPWTLYQCTGDKEALARAYPCMTSWLDYVAAQEKETPDWAAQHHFGDWLAWIPKTPTEW